MKPAIVFTTDSLYGDFKKGDKGVVDGYVRGGDDTPCAVIIKEDGRFVIANLYEFKLSLPN